MATENNNLMVFRLLPIIMIHYYNI